MSRYRVPRRAPRLGLAGYLVFEDALGRTCVVPCAGLRDADRLGAWVGRARDFCAHLGVLSRVGAALTAGRRVVLLRERDVGLFT